MPQDSVREHNNHKKVQRAEHTALRTAANAARLLGHETAPGYRGPSVGDSRLNGRGNQSVKIAAMRLAQQTYGNRAVQRFLQRSATGNAYGRNIPVQRCGGQVHEGCACATRHSGRHHSSSEQAVQRQEDEAPAVVESIAPVEVKGERHKEVAFAAVPQVNLQGKTTATFDGGKSKTKDQITTAATGCKGCKDKECITVTGTLEMTFTVTTKVTLPKVPTVPKLTKCQKERVKEAIDGTLASHEQEHVDAFEMYNGTVEESFELTKCKSLMPAALKSMAKARTKEVEKDRRADAKAASAALDPFNFDIDLDCEDEKKP